MAPKKKARPAKSKVKSWQDIATEAQELRDESIRVAGGDIQVSTSDLSQANLLKFISFDGQRASNDLQWLAEGITRGELSAVDIIRAFMKRAAEAQKLTNCLSELLGERALARAAQLDAFYAETGRTAGPLHGVPISVKSHIGVRNCRMPSGYVAWWNNFAPQDALVVQILERAGAVVHARTTEPQGMMQLECVSNLFGVTTNPRNAALSAGGSSGGEAALLALRGSCIGVGSDIGGSIRVPAAACGIYGLKPTGFRVPTRGWSSTPPGADPIPTVIGPMSASIDGIERFMRVVLAAEPWVQEPALVPLPWREIAIQPSPDKPLRLGIALHDGLVRPHPPIIRALKELVNKLKSLPYVEVVNHEFYKNDEAWAIASSLYYPDGGAADRQAMAQSGEPILPLMQWMLDNDGVQNLSRESLEYWLEEREEFRIEVAEAWNKTGSGGVAPIDALICPVAPGVAARHGTTKYWGYSAVWNLLDYPALAFPAGTVNKAVDVETRSDFISGHDKDNWSHYDADLFDGMSIGLQLVGRRFDDEKIIEILKYLQLQELV